MTNTTDLSRYVEKPISATSQALADYLTEHTGYAVDARTVSLVQDLHGAWQKSPGNQKRIAEAKAANAAKVAARAERVTARAAKAAEPKPAKAPAAKAAPVAKKPAPRPRRVAQKVAK